MYVNIMHSTSLLCRINNTLRSILTKLAILWGGLWGAGYPRENGFKLIILHTHVVGGHRFNINLKSGEVEWKVFLG